MDADLFSTHAELIESVLSASCRLHRLAPDNADEFRSWARLRLLDRDQAILRKFAHRSSWRTYLITVVERLYLDWRNHEWGKWRPSSEARRLGEAAVELERLVLRDRVPFGEAVQQLVSRGVADVAECERAWARLPRRPSRQRVDDQELEHVASPESGGDPAEQASRRQREALVLEALGRAVAALPPADQLILRLRYWSGVKVSQIAALNGHDARQLYRRFEQIWSDLRRRLETDGVSVADLAGPLGSFPPPEPAPRESVAGGTEAGEKRRVGPSGSTGTGGDDV